MTAKQYAILVKPLPRGQLQGMNYRQRQQALKDHNASIMHRLLAQLSGLGLRDQVVTYDVNSVFNTIFIETTKKVADVIAADSEVEKIALQTEMRAELF